MVYGMNMASYKIVAIWFIARSLVIYLIGLIKLVRFADRFGLPF
jgi:hypothetical protein